MKLLLAATATIGVLPTSAPPFPQAGAQDASGVQVQASLSVPALEVGGTYSFEVYVELPEGVAASESGVPAPFLQLDVPPSVKLTEPALTSYRELAKNEFLQEPYERLVRESPVRIPFELVSEPEEGETIGMNVLAYVRPGGDETAGGEADYFLRRRIELPVAARAQSRAGDPGTSTWGTDERLLQIGQKATSFTLPQGPGDEPVVALDDLLGKKNIIVTTYRAHW